MEISDFSSYIEVLTVSSFAFSFSSISGKVDQFLNTKSNTTVAYIDVTIREYFVNKKSELRNYFNVSLKLDSEEDEYNELKTSGIQYIDDLMIKTENYTKLAQFRRTTNNFNKLSFVVAIFGMIVLILSGFIQGKADNIDIIKDIIRFGSLFLINIVILTWVSDWPCCRRIFTSDNINKTKCGKNRNFFCRAISYLTIFLIKNSFTVIFFLGGALIYITKPLLVDTLVEHFFADANKILVCLLVTALIFHIFLYIIRHIIVNLMSIRRFKKIRREANGLIIKYEQKVNEFRDKSDANRAIMKELIAKERLKYKD